MSSRAAVLIDNGYLSVVLREDFMGNKVDYLDLSNAVCSDNNCERVISLLYDGRPYQPHNPSKEDISKYAGKMKFFNEIKKLPQFDIRWGKQIPVYDPDTGKYKLKQKGVDVLLAIDMVVMALDPKRKVDSIILIAGDADFEPAVQYVRSLGVNVILYHSNMLDGGGKKKYSDSLRYACSKACSIDSSLITRCFQVDHLRG